MPASATALHTDPTLSVCRMPQDFRRHKGEGEPPGPEVIQLSRCCRGQPGQPVESGGWGRSEVKVGDRGRGMEDSSWTERVPVYGERTGRNSDPALTLRRQLCYGIRMLPLKTSFPVKTIKSSWRQLQRETVRICPAQSRATMSAILQ